MHRDERGAAPDRPKRHVEVAVAEIVAAVADHDGRKLAGRGGIGFVRRYEGLAVELPERIGCGDCVDTPAGVVGRRVGCGGRGRGDEPRRGHGTVGESPRQRLAMSGREVRDDPERDALGHQPRQRLPGTGQELALEDDDAVGVEHQPADAGERLGESSQSAILGRMLQPGGADGPA